MNAKRKQKTGAFLRWYGPRGARTYAHLVQTKIDPDTPAGLFAEPTRSTFEQCQKVRGNA